MSEQRIVRFGLSNIGATPAAGINLTDAQILNQTEAGPIGLTAKGFTRPYSMCHDWSGNLYIADITKHCVYKVTEGGTISTVAGLAGTPGNNGALMNVLATDARFNSPKGIACDKSGTIYVADSGNNQIRTIRGGYVSLLAGGGNAASGMVDGANLTARFNDPADVYVDRSGTIYVADRGNHAIRKIMDGQVLTIAGNGFSGDMENTQVTKYKNMFNGPYNICCDTQGNLYVVDYNNYKIKKITPNGWIYLFSGNGTIGRSLGTAPNYSYTCQYTSIYDLDNDESGNIYVLDKGAYSRLLKLSFDGRPSVVAEFAETSYNGYPDCMCCSPAQKLFVGMSPLQ